MEKIISLHNARNSKSDLAPYALSRYIGGTTFMVNAYFSKTNKERIEDKIFRLLVNDIMSTIEKDAA